MTLYDYELSGNCFKVRLLLSILAVEYQSHTVEFYPAADHQARWFKKINPLAQLPVLEDGELVLRDSAAILVYLAAKYDSTGHWYPLKEPERLGAVMQWLSFADQLTASAGCARLAESFFMDFDIDACRTRAQQLFRILDEHLWFAEQQQQRWLVPGDRATIADLACFPYVMLSEEGSISRQDYPAIRRWTDRVRSIAGFTVMPGIFAPGSDMATDTPAETGACT